jgi:acyl-CoA synthetase (AMP-forming)/AMP-acid ligase II
MAKSFNPKTQTYSSPRPPIHLPANPNLSLTSFLFQSTSSFPHTVALIDDDTGETLTFHQLQLQVSKLSQSLLQLSIDKHDVVLIVAPNAIHFPVCFLTVVALGAVVSTCNPSYTISELSKQVAESSTVLTVAELTVADLTSPYVVNQFQRASVFAPRPISLEHLRPQSPVHDHQFAYYHLSHRTSLPIVADWTVNTDMLGEEGP